MNTEHIQISQVITARNDILIKQKEIYLSAVKRLNVNTRELLNNDFGSTLVKNSLKDLAGEVARRFFDMGDYYITVDQLYDRFVHFSYDQDIDLLTSDEAIRKAYYNFEDSNSSETLRNISKTCQKAQKKLFVENRSQDRLDQKGKKSYRQSKTTVDGRLYDELTGQEGKTRTIIKNGKEVSVSDLQADHIQARETITYNSRYIREEKIEKLKEFYNSADNMQMIHASANTSKGDVRVCEVNGKVEYLNAKEMRSRQEKGEAIIDITSKASAEQLADAVVNQWEKETRSGNKTETLKEKGYLDENGKVKPGVRKELERKIRHSQNCESVKILEVTDYGNAAEDAAVETTKSLQKILAGQVIYYVLPPIIFETQSIIKRKDMNLDTFLTELKKAGKRVVKYVSSKLGEIFKNVASNSISKFIKTFFDIIIEMVKATVKKLMQIIKQLVMSLVNCCKVLVDKKSSAAQKADSITKILSVTVTAIVMELLLEYLEKQFGLPEFLMEPLQIVVTVLATNIIMLILQKADLFDIQYGLLVSNIERVFDETNEIYLSESAELFKNDTKEMLRYMQLIKDHIFEIKESIASIDIKKEEVTPYLDQLSSMFNMEIDFNKEWNEFVEAV